MNLFATHPLGFSDLIEQEVLSCGGRITARSTAGIGFEGSLECAYRMCLWSRVANRILLQIDAFDAPEPDALYYGIQRTDWQAHLNPGGSIAVDFVTTRSQINHSLYGAQRVKDAIVDQLRDATGARPDVDIKSPDVRINVFLDGDRASVAIDLSGESLHRRGYRQIQGPAPLKENLAAALLLRAGWPQIARDGGALLDPMCGSGTFAIEALLMAADIAPNLGRSAFGFARWKQHEESVWQPLLADARARRERGLASAPVIRASDHDARAVDAALRNCEAAGLSPYVTVEQRELSDIAPPAPRGLLICNPPYGERLSDVDALPALFSELGTVLRERFDGWRASILAPDVELGFRTGLRLKKKNAARNGAIAVVLLTFDVAADRALPPRNESSDGARHQSDLNKSSDGARHRDEHPGPRCADPRRRHRRFQQPDPQEPQAPRPLGATPRGGVLSRLRRRSAGLRVRGGSISLQRCNAAARAGVRPTRTASMRPRRNCGAIRWQRCCRICSASTPRTSS